MFPVQHFHHRFLVDPHHRAIGYRGCGAQADRLPRKATLPEEIALVQDADGRFLSALGQDSEFYLSFPYIKNRIGGVALSEDALLFGSGCDRSSAADGRK